MSTSNPAIESAAGTSPLYEAVSFFVFTFAELAVLFVLISLAVAWLRQRLPAERIQSLLGGRSGYLAAVGLGAVTPFCSCSTLPMLTGLLQARAAFGPAMAFLLTSPLLNPYVVALFWLVFGPQVMLVYTLVVLVTAIGAGLLLERLGFERYVTLPEASGKTCSSGTRPGWRQFTGEALGQLRQFLPHLLLGVGVGSVVHGYVPESLIARLAGEPAWWLVPAAALAGILLYLRASTMIPVAASLVAKGASLGPVLALTVGGAGASLPEMIMLKRLFRWPLLAAFILVVLGTACLTAFGLMALDWSRA
ncbi:MAG: permease [Wenzhouxiangella sp.]